MDGSTANCDETTSGTVMSFSGDDFRAIIAGTDYSTATSADIVDQIGLFSETALGCILCYIPAINALGTCPIFFTHWFAPMPFSMLIFDPFSISYDTAPGVVTNLSPFVPPFLSLEYNFK